MKMLMLAVSMVALAACSPEVPDADTAEETVQPLAEGTPLARRALRVVEASKTEAALRALGVRAADATLIMSHRRGPDGVLGTEDDDPIQRIDELSKAMRPTARATNLQRLKKAAVSEVGDDGACDADSPRGALLPVFVTPDATYEPVQSMLAAAERNVEVTMYQLSSKTIRGALEQAAERGVRVRVLLDRAQQPNAKLVTELEAAGIEARLTSSRFVYTHQKSMTVDGERTLVFSGNFDRASFETGRNYGVVTQDPEDVWDAQDLFEADWNDEPIDLGCTRLILAPQNARTRLVAMIDAAMATLDVEALYASEPEVLSAIERARARGVAVRVLFNDPKFDVGDASKDAARLKKKGIAVRKLPSMFIHAKVLVVDGAQMFVGSENLSTNSLVKNREVGLRFALSTDAAGLVADTFEGDWTAGVSF